jgi:hypothetical protein
MRLELSDGSGLDDPTPEQIAEALAALPADAGSFAILSREELTYLQTSGSAKEGFVLEYQEGGLDQHYQSVAKQLPLDLVTRAFQCYAAADESWRELTAFEHEAPGGAPWLPRGVVAAALAVAAALVALCWRAA